MKHAHVDDADVDAFIAKYLPQLDPAWTAERRANALYDLALNLIPLLDDEASKAWTAELAQRVRKRAMWMTP